MPFRVRSSHILLLSATLLAGCGDSSGPNGSSAMTLSLATRAGSAPAAGMAAFSVGPTFDTVALAGDTIVISQAQVVLRHLKLERVEGQHACGDTETEAEGHDDKAQDCEETKLGPLLVDLPLGPGAKQTFTAAVDTGTYDRLEAQIHAAQGSDAADVAFLQANPNFNNVSIRVTGTYKGTAFTYTSPLNVTQEADLVPPVAVTASAPASLTLFTDLSTWFVDAGTGKLVDPATALTGQPNENLVTHNIKASFKSFEDKNEDGRDDH